MGELEVVHGPRVERRDAVATLGIREVVPFRSMLSNRDRLLAELRHWLDQRGLRPEGPFFLRLHVVDMSGPMDIEVGVIAPGSTGDARVRPGSLPAGDYAVLAYRDRSMAANRMLRDWVTSEGLALDAWSDSSGEAFAARCEIYLSDTRAEKLKTRWLVELAFLLRE